MFRIADYYVDNSLMLAVSANDMEKVQKTLFGQ